MEPRKALSGFLWFLALAALLALFFAFREHATFFHGPRVSVSARHLPYYAFCSFCRMLAAYVLSLAFAIPYGLFAARGGVYERIMIPAIDIAQSVPVIGFFPAAIYFFVSLAHGSRLGVEMAAVFLIFTSQAWNLALGVFESARTIPSEITQALDTFGASDWLRLRRLLLPICVPKLVYNSILSWVAGWYFLIACEIISVGPTHYRLPGLGSYLMEAANRGRSGEIVAALLVQLAIIIAMDLVVWRPLSAWSEKFRYEFLAGAGEPMSSLALLTALGDAGAAGARFLRRALHPLWPVFQAVSVLIERLEAPHQTAAVKALRWAGRIFVYAFLGLVAYGLASGAIALVRALMAPWPGEVRAIPAAAGASLLRLVIAYLISLAWTLPCAVAASESPRFSRWLAPLAQIVGSIPATALFPLIVLLVIRLTGGMNLASILLILTGMQWYLLFNLLAGVSQIPEDLKEAVRGFGLTRSATWRRLTVPALTPSLVTGSITAWGGGWNALILSEYFVFRGHTYQVTGLGALLDAATYGSGNGAMILLSLLSMVVIVIVLNRLVWRRLYDLAMDRFRVDY